MRKLATGNVHHRVGNHPDVVGKHSLQTGEGPEPSGTRQARGGQCLVSAALHVVLGRFSSLLGFQGLHL